MRNRLPSSLLVLLALLVAQGCGMRSVINEDTDGPEAMAEDPGDAVAGTSAPQPEPDAGPRDSGSGDDNTHPCGRPGARGCDATDLDGHSCQSLGAGSGTLACDPVTCTFDLSMCTGAPGNDGAAGAPALFGGGLFGAGNNNAGGGFFGSGAGDATLVAGSSAAAMETAAATVAKAKARASIEPAVPSAPRSLRGRAARSRRTCSCDSRASSPTWRDLRSRRGRHWNRIPRASSSRRDRPCSPRRMVRSRIVRARSCTKPVPGIAPSTHSPVGT